jgi:hypothetical protein
MNAGKFTAGPWVAKFGGLIEIEAPTVPRGPDGSPAIVAEVCDDGQDDAAVRADAFLIAAAPDLLEVARGVVAITDNPDRHSNLHAMTVLVEQARKALAKAVRP